MATLQKIRYELIDVIMRTVDAQKLREAYVNLTALKDGTAQHNARTSRDGPPTVEVRRGVTLASIRDSQHISRVTLSDILDVGREESWDQTLEELLRSID